MSDTEFWQAFRISPTRLENAILTHFPWVLGIVVCPLLFLILESAIISLLVHDEFLLDTVFQDLSDPIFSFLTLAILLAGLVFVTRWRAQVEPAFRALLGKDRVSERDGQDTSDDNMTVLTAYQRQLHSRKRFLSVICIVMLMLIISVVELEGRYASFDEFIHRSQDPLLNLLLLTHMATRWALSAVLWGAFGGLALWVAAVTNKTIRDLTNCFQIRVQPMHPDRVGGLRPLGDLFSSLGLIVLVFSLPLAIFGISGSNEIIKSRRCLKRLNLPNRLIEPMDRQDLVVCLTLINQAAFSSPYDADYSEQLLQRALDRGLTLDEIAGQMADEFLAESSDNLSLEETILKGNRLPLFFLSGLALVLIAAGVLILRPLWVIHRSMVDQKERTVAELAGEAAVFHSSLGREVENHRWDEAGATRDKLEMVQKLLYTEASAPTWPVSFPRVLRYYILPALLSAGLSFGLKSLNLLLSPEGELVMESLIDAFTSS